MPSVLIAGNNDVFRRSFKEILKMHIPSLSVDKSVAGSEALTKINQSSPDIVFMGIRLPGKNGLELRREIKCLHPNLVISTLSATTFPSTAKSQKNTGWTTSFLKTLLRAPKSLQWWGP
ncbi:MAG: response regulator [Syntrophobacteraceae bacterium]|jgi:DNA-binding NarL/FixJ family response regulator